MTQKRLAPNGIPISQGFIVTKNKNQRANMIRLAITELDYVLADGKLAIVPIKFGVIKNDSGEKLEGVTVSQVSVIEIIISQSTRFPAMTTLHEIGHRIEIDALSYGTANTNRLSLIYNALFPWRTSIRASPMVQELQGFMQSKTDDFQYAYELLKPSELFARSFAQYVVIRSGHQDLYAELETIRNCENLGFRVRSLLHWSDEEFKPIGAAFDQVFLRLGWIK